MSRKNEKQARFSDSLDHIRLVHQIRQKKERVYSGKKKKKRRFPRSSRASAEELSQSFSRIYSKSMTRTKIYRDPKMYFVIGFSDVLSWKSIEDSLKNLRVSIVDVMDEKTIKVSLPKEQYEFFLYNLRKNHRYIEELTETSLSEKIRKPLMENLRNEPDQKSWFTFELVNLSGIEEPETLEKSIIEFVRSKDLGNIRRSYLSDSLLVLSGPIKHKAVEEIAEEIEAITKVFKIPRIELMVDESNLTLPSATPIISLSHETTVEALPVCIIDSGVNSKHQLLKDFIEDRFDYSTQSNGPCRDDDGHGSMVSGLTIYGDDVRKKDSHITKVVMVKNFENHQAIEKDLLKVIFETTIRYRFISNVFNFSFAANGPNPTLTKALDELIYRRDLIAVCCAGNIKLALIKNHINNGYDYPKYIELHKIFFPGDCRNVITVGSYASKDSNIVEAGWPSPFTRSSPSIDLIKPDVMSCGGNLSANFAQGKVASFSSSGLGVCSASNIDNEILEKVGTSFCSPVIACLAASIASKYPNSSPFLVKALILSSCQYLSNRARGIPDHGIQGFGKPDRTRALYCQSWRACYLLEGQFEAKNSKKYHRYRFLFPDEADEIEVTLVCGKLHTMYDGEKADYVRLRFNRPGVKFATLMKPQTRLGNKKCSGTYKTKSIIQRGSKGVWSVDVIPHFFSPVSNQKLKYACVVTVSSSRGKEVYTPIINWIRPKKEMIKPVKVPVSPSSIR